MNTTPLGSVVNLGILWIINVVSEQEEGFQAPRLNSDE